MPVKIHPKVSQKLRDVVIEDGFCSPSLTSLTVWKKSLVFNGNGFTVFDPAGNLAFRVDNYYSGSNNEIVLMDASGNSLLTMKRKRLSLQHEWQAFLGDKSNDQKPLFTVRRPSLFISSKALAEILVESSKQKKNPDFQIEGSYAKRSCTAYNSSHNIIFEMKRKQVTSEITLGGDVFSVIVQPGYDQAFVMGLIVILDQIISSNAQEDGRSFRLSSSPSIHRHSRSLSLSLGVELKSYLSWMKIS